MSTSKIYTTSKYSVALVILIMFVNSSLDAQVKVIPGNRVGIGTLTPQESAKLDINSPNSGLLIPRIPYENVIPPPPAPGEMQAVSVIVNPVDGLQVYLESMDDDLRGVYYYDGGLLQWVKMGGSDVGFQTLSASETIPGNISLSNDPGGSITINVDDADFDPDNENQDLSSDLAIPGNISISNGNSTLINVDDADFDPENEHQTLSKSGNDLTLSKGGGTVNISDGDSSDTNEIQVLSINVDTVFLSSGGFVILPDLGDFTKETLEISDGSAYHTLKHTTSLGEEKEVEIWVPGPPGPNSTPTQYDEGGFEVAEFFNPDGDATYTLTHYSSLGNNNTIGLIHIPANLDNEPTNEIQTISDDGTNISLDLGGGSIAKRFMDYSQEDITGFRNRSTVSPYMIIQDIVASGGAAEAGIFLGEDEGGAGTDLDENFGLRYINRNFLLDFGSDLVEANRTNLMSFSKSSSTGIFYVPMTFQDDVTITETDITSPTKVLTTIGDGVIGTSDFSALQTDVNYWNQESNGDIWTDENVGYGISTPESGFHIFGDQTRSMLLEASTGAAPNMRIRGRRVNANASVQFGGQLLLERFSATTAITPNAVLGTILFGGNHTTNDKNNIEYAASISGRASGDFNSKTDMPTELVFRTGQAGELTNTVNKYYGTDRMVIQADGDITMTEKLGIGTDTPSSPLQIANNVKTNFSNFANYQLLLYQAGASNSSYGLGIRSGTFALNTGGVYDFDHNGVTTLALSASLLDMDGNIKMNELVENNPTRVVTTIGDGVLKTTDLSTYAGLNNYWTENSASELYRNTNVGIGLVNPNAKLHVLGSANIQGTDYTSHFGFGANEDLYLRAGKSAGKVIIADVNAGNVGIGISNPNEKLVVDGSIGLAYTNGLAHQGLRRSGVVTEFYNNITLANGNVIYRFINKGDLPILTMTQGRNVGVGIADPVEQLQIGNGFTFHDGGHKLIGFNYGAGSPLDNTKYSAEIRLNPTAGKLSLGTSASVTASPIKRMTIDKNGNIGIGTESPTARLEVNTTGAATGPSGWNIGLKFTNGSHNAIWNTAGGLFFGLHSNANFYWGKENNGSVGHKMLLNTTTGNLGIGTTTPAEKLHVNGSIRGHRNGAIRIQTPHGWTDVGSRHPSWSYFETDRPAFYFNKRISVNGDISSYNTQDLRLGTHQTERVRVLRSNGYMGIGKIDPKERLDVNGNIKMIESHLCNPSKIVVTDGLGVLKTDDVGKYENLWLENGGDIYRNSGNVGINTANPQANLEILFEEPSFKITDEDGVLADGELSSTIEFGQSDVQGGGFSRTTNASIRTYGKGTAGELDLAFNTGDDSEKMRISSNGNVGIGTDDPEESLHVVGRIQPEFPNAGDSNIAIGKDAGNFNSAGVGNLIFGNEAGKEMINSNKNVLIGLNAGDYIDNCTENIVIGMHAGRYLNGDFNLVQGDSAATFMNGDYNISIGQNSGGTSIGDNNILLGQNAGLAQAGSDNICIGRYSGRSSSGSNNTSVGEFAGYSCNGNSNSNFGVAAGANISGFLGLGHNTFIGSNTIAASHNITNSSILGADGIVNASNKILLHTGDPNSGILETDAPTFITSDGRFKSSIQGDVPGLDFINRLNPVTYNFETLKYKEHLVQLMTDSVKAYYLDTLNYSDQLSMRQIGFIAQEVDMICDEINFEFRGLSKPDPLNPTSHYSLAYSQFVVPLVKAVQEQQDLIEKQETKIQALIQESIEKDTMLEDLLRRVESLERE